MALKLTELSYWLDALRDRMAAYASYPGEVDTRTLSTGR